MYEHESLVQSGIERKEFHNLIYSSMKLILSESKILFDFVAGL